MTSAATASLGSAGERGGDLAEHLLLGAPASRSASVSPTQMIGVMPWRRIAVAFLATISSVSPNSSRRSLWPQIT